VKPDVAVERGEAKTCMTKKEGWGRCLIDTTCAHSCRKYGYMGGKCQGITRRCYCLLNCWVAITRRFLYHIVSSQINIASLLLLHRGATGLSNYIYIYLYIYIATCVCHEQVW